MARFRVRQLWKNARRRQTRNRSERKPRKLLAELLEDRRVLAAISWDGGGGNLLWSNPLNWNGPVPNQLPGPNDDVTINAAGNVTITYDSSTVTDLKSLNTSDSLSITAGGLRIAAAFTLNPGLSLTVAGVGTTFSAVGITDITWTTVRAQNGAILDLPGITGDLTDASLYAESGATLSVPNVTRWARAARDREIILEAVGVNSKLLLPGITELNMATGPGSDDWAYVQARDGGFVNLSAVVQQTGGYLQLNALGSGSIIDVSNLVSVVGTGTQINVQTGSRIDVGAALSAQNSAISLAVNALLVGGLLDIRAGSTLSGQGQIFGNIRNSGGTVTAGSAPTGLTIHGDYTQTAAGKLSAAVDGAVDTSSYSQLIVDGKATLAGTLEITRANSYAPDLFTDYAIISAETVSGTFSTVTGGTITGGNLAPQYGFSVVALSRSFDRTPVATFPYQNTLPNQRTFFNASQIAGSRAEFRIYDPNGKLVGLSNATPTSPNAGDFGTFLLKDVGAYEVRVYGPIGGNPTFVAAPNAAPLTTQPGFFKKATNGEISAPGTTQAWEFDARVGDEISLDVLSIIGAGQQLSFTLIDPSGRAVYQRKATAEAFNDADFGPYFAAMDGKYTLTVDGVGDDTAAYQFLVSGPQAPRIRSHAVKGPDAATVNEAWFLFDQAMDATSFSLASDLLSFQNPTGPLTATGFRWQDSTTLVITFAPQPSDVPLFMALAPTILNAAGVGLDQDNDRIPTEATDDQYLANLVVDNKGPFVIYTQPGTTASAPIDRVTFYFSEPIDAATFSLADITTFTGPGGVDLKSQLTNFLVGEKSVTVFFNKQEAGGQFKITIGPNIADAAGNLMDQSRDGTNGQTDDSFTLTTNVQSPDLVVASVANPTAATHGQDLTLTWTVQNNGADPATGTWWDYVYLSADDKWDLGDALVGKKLYNGAALAANGGNYQGTLTAAMPGILPGDYRVIVRTNILQNLTEATQSNNTGVSANAAHFELPALTSGVVATRNVNYRQELYYKFVVPADKAGGSLILKLGTSNTTLANELYVRRDALPTRMTYDARSQQGLASNQYIILSSLKAGTYYVLGEVAPDQQQVGAAGTANIQADLLVPGQFTVVDSAFGQGGTAGNRTIEINGVNFDRTMTAKLTNATGASVDAVSYYRVGPEKLYATFDLTHVTPGTYNVILTNAAGQIKTVANSLEVIAGGGGNNLPSVVAPEAFRRVFHAPYVHFPITVNWENTGINDAPSPFVKLQTNEPFGDDLDSVLAGMGDYEVVLLADGPITKMPGVLLPGERGSQTYEVVPRLRQEVGSSMEALSYEVDRLYKKEDELFDWNSLITGLPEAQTSFAIADDVLQQLRVHVGDTKADFGRMLARNLTAWAGTTSDQLSGRSILTELIWMEIESATAAVRTSVIGQINAPDFAVKLAGATVVLTNTGTAESFDAIVRSDGKFYVSDLSAGTYRLTFDSGVIPETTFTLAAGQHKAITVNAERGGEISGIITRASGGQPIVGATVHITGTDRITTTDSAGGYSFAFVAPGDYSVEVTAAGFGGRTNPVGLVKPAGATTSNVTLAVAGGVQGTLKNSVTLAPLAGVRGRLVAVGHDGLSATFVTDSAGRVNVSDLAAGQYQLELADAHWLLAPMTVNVTAGSNASVNLLAEAAAGVVGTVKVNGLAFADNVQIELLNLDGSLVKSAVLDKFQRFSITGLPSGNYSVQLRVQGIVLVSKSVAVTTGAQLDVGSLAPTGLVRINGAVPDANSGLTILVETSAGDSVLSTTTDQSGGFILGILKDGSYRVRAVAQDATYVPAEFQVVGGLPNTSSITLAKGTRTVTGNVTSPAGQILAGARVYARRVENGAITAETVSGNSDAQGNFSLANLIPGTYRLFAFADGAGFISKQIVITSANVDAGVFQLTTPHTLSGTIKDLDDVAVAGAQVVLYEVATGAIAGFATASELGTFEIRDLAAGAYEAVISSPNRQTTTTPVNLTNLATDLTIALPASQTSVSGILRDSEGRPITGAVVYALDGQGRVADLTTTDRAGGFELVGIPPIQTTIVAEAGGARSVRSPIDLIQTHALSLSLDASVEAVVLTIPVPAAVAASAPTGSGSVWDNFWSDPELLADKSIELPKKPDCLSEEARRLYSVALATVFRMKNELSFVKGIHSSLRSGVGHFVGTVLESIGKIGLDILQLLPSIKSIRAILALTANRTWANIAVAAAGSAENAISVAQGIAGTYKDPWNTVKDLNATASALNGARSLVKDSVEAIAIVQRQSGDIFQAARREMSAIQLENFAKAIGKLAGVASLLLDIESAFESIINEIEGIELLNSEMNISVNKVNLLKTQARKAIDAFNKAIAQQSVHADAIDDNDTICVGQMATGNVLGNDIPVDCMPGSIFVTSSLANVISRSGGYSIGGLSPGKHTYSYSIGYKDKEGREIIADNATLFIDVMEKKDCPPPPDPCADPRGYNDWKKACKCSDADGGGSTADCGSMDPNDIIGPYGAGADRFVPKEGSLNYTVNFENDPEKATAPAAVVRISQTLDSDLDFNTFELGTLGFGDVLITESVGQSSFETRLDLRERFGIFLDVHAGIDTSTGKAFWEFESIDPATGGVPFSPLIGFLPPNVDGVEGQGFVHYSVKAKASAQTGDRIDAVANIVFDQNQGIATPAIFNTIDANGPTSQVAALAAQNVPGFLVKWSGADDANGSGIHDYDIYVSDNSGPYQLWLAETTATEAKYLDAVPGHSYAFYSIATDLVGHTEAAPTTADATTLATEPATTTVASVVATQSPHVAITVEFADPLTVQSLIDAGTIRSALAVVSHATGPVSLANWQFSYDAATRKLSLTTTDNLPAGIYDLQLDGSQFQTAAGIPLKGGASGIVFGIPAYAAPTIVQANGADLTVTGDSSPALADWNGDGKTDLIVGEKSGTSEAKIRAYLNHGTNAAPVYTDFVYAQTPTGVLTVAANSEMGVLPRLFDWNGDDELDLVLGLADGRVQVWTNVNTKSAPIFALPTYVEAGAAGSKQAIDVGDRATLDIADWNNDGKFDLVVGGADGRVQVFLNSASTGADFAAGQVLPLGAGTLVVPSGRASVDVADLNQDGRKDLVVGNTDGQLLVYLNNGWDSQPIFTKAYALKSDGNVIDLDGSARTKPFVGDWDHDGRLDLVVGANDGKVHLFRGLSTIADTPDVKTVAGGQYAFTFDVINDTTPPTVQQIAVRATTWTEGFSYFNGYALPTAGPAVVLPWSGVNQIKVTFSEDVVVTQNSLTLSGVNVPNYAFSNFEYVTGTHTATWTLATPLAADKLLVQVNSSVHDPLGNSLVTVNQRFDVMPGDANRNGSTAVSDVGALKTAMGTSTGQQFYDAFADLDGNGTVSTADVGALRANLGLSVPMGEPAIPTYLAVRVAAARRLAFEAADFTEPPVIEAIVPVQEAIATALVPSSVGDLVAARQSAFETLLPSDKPQRSRPAPRPDWPKLAGPDSIGKLDLVAIDLALTAREDATDFVDSSLTANHNRKTFRTDRQEKITTPMRERLVAGVR